jgi:hypothetical protein
VFFASAEADARRVSAFEGRFQSAQSLRPAACAPNEFGLQGPPADGRPAPTEKARSASAKADARRTAPSKADFNRHKSLRPTVGLHAE